jgi:hypothetical protein
VVIDLTRRQFLISVATGVTVMPAVGWPFLDQFVMFRSEEAQTLLAMAKTLFPHPRIGDSDYMRAVAAIYLRCDADETVSDSVRSGLAVLGPRFASATEPVRVAVLKRMEGTWFFRVVYVETLESLYGSAGIW